jgi:acyl-coenzyme A thioesterase PaaI-like protein
LSSAPLDPAAAVRVRASFARQGAMATLGAEVTDVVAGRVAIALPIEPRLSQQDGFLHAGVSSPPSTAPVATRR